MSRSDRCYPPRWVNRRISAFRSYMTMEKQVDIAMWWRDWPTRGSPDADSIHFRRRQLAKRLTLHQARAKTIQLFTGYTRHRLAWLRRCAGISPNTRPRGPSPQSFCLRVMSSSGKRDEAAAGAIFCIIFETTRRTTAPDSLEDLEWGERVCDCWEALRACHPGLTLEFEEFLLLTKALSTQSIRLVPCKVCAALVVTELVEMRCNTCETCKRRSRSSR